MTVRLEFLRNARQMMASRTGIRPASFLQNPTLLGFYIVSEPSGYTGAGYNSGLYFIGVVGMRYFLNDNMAFYADAGAGAGSLHVGLSWKLGGGA